MQRVIISGFILMPNALPQGPFGATIAHGYLTMSLAAKFMPEIIEVRGIAMGVNYGTEKTRFPSPVTVGSKLSATGTVGIGRRGKRRH
jgi:acyl dehydratase